MITEVEVISIIGSKLFSDFVSKAVSDGVDMLKNAIKNADKDRESGNHNLQANIYTVILDALNQFTYNKYNGKDELYDTAERILKVFISGKYNIEAVKIGLKRIDSSINDDRCLYFLNILCHVICKDNNSVLYKEIDMLWKWQESNYSHGEFEKNNQNHIETHEILGDIKEDMGNLQESIDNVKDSMHEVTGMFHTMKRFKAEYFSEIPIANRAEEYAEKWNKNVFLNNYDEEDERAGDRVNIKLKDIYLKELLPSYKLNENQGLSHNLKGRLERYIVNKSNRGMLLILGQPGIGKSTLITWVMANLVERKDEIFVYKFASDLKQVNWQGEDILGEIFIALRLREKELKKKVLILDGFDELSIRGDREKTLNKLYQELDRISDSDRFSLIITCRENYVRKSSLIGFDYITLQEWNEGQIKSFCDIYEKKSTGNLEAKFSEAKSDKILKYEKIFGIPLILYMILALDIDVEKSSSIVDVYDQIFSLTRGGIYERFYDVEHRINEFEIKNSMHQISQKIAFWIFEHNSEKAFIPQAKFEVICKKEMNGLIEQGKNMQKDVFIGGYFEGIGTDELHFVHRSIYEYFVAVYFLEVIKKLIELKVKKEEFAREFGKLLKKGRLSKQILEFIKYKFDSMKGYNLSKLTKEVFQKMLQSNMTYNIGDLCENVMESEMNIFANMLEIVHLWNPVLGKVDNRMISYLKYNHYDELNLAGIELCKTKLFNVYLYKANMGKANLSGSNFGDAVLNGADLSEANLSETFLFGASLSGARLVRADLSGADLSGIKLCGAKLNGANLFRAFLRWGNFRGADLSRVNLSEAYITEANLVGVNLREANLSKINTGPGRVKLVMADQDISYFSFLSGLSNLNLSKDILNLYDRGSFEINLGRADLSGANLSGANLKDVNLNRANLREADLRETCLFQSSLIRTDLRGADLRGADLRGADLREANLRGADLREADLREADLRRVDLSGADLINMVIDEKQVNELRRKYDIKDSRVYISETNEIISYKLYCMRTQEKRI